MQNAIPIRPVLPAPSVKRNPGSVDRGTLLPFLQYAFNQVQRRPRVRAADRRR